MATKAELEEALAEAEAALAEEQARKAKAAEVPVSVAELERQAGALRDAALADPGNGRVLFHLNNIVSEIGALHNAEDTEARLERPEGE